MNWETLLSTPPPDTVWSLDDQTIVVVHRDRKTGDRCAAVDVPRGVFEMGPAGLRSVDVERLQGLLASLHERIKGSRRVGVVLPTHWARCFLLEAEELPSRQADLMDVLRWRLKKLLPVSPADLRIAYSVQPPVEDVRHVLCSTAPEKGLAQMENAFEDAGLSPGLVLPRIFALALESSRGGVSRVFVQQEDVGLSLMAVANGGVRLVRTKPLSQSGGSWSGVEREIRLLVSYIRSTLGIDGSIEAVVSASNEELARLMIPWLEEQPSVAATILDARQICPDAHLAATLGSGRLAPMSAVLEGGAP